jgi:hypothetical protein
MYKIIGGDNQEYGPVSAEEVREWVRQNRANGNTLAKFETGPWKPLATFPEFKDLWAATGSIPPQGMAMPPGTTAPPLSSLGGTAIHNPTRNKWAVAGLVFAILALVPCCWMCPAPGLAGIVFGSMGLIQIRANPGAYSTTKTVPILAIALSVLSIFIGIALMNSPTFKEQLREFEKELRKMQEQR